MPPRKILILVLILSASVDAPGQVNTNAATEWPCFKLLDFRGHTAREAAFAGATLYTDQDLLSLGINEDRNYTMGFGIGSTGKYVNRAVPTSWLLWGINCMFGVEMEPDNIYLTKHEILALGSAFTPDKLDTSTVIIGDRPYGSIIALSTRLVIVPFSRVDDSREDDYREGVPNSAVRSELVIGALGLALPGELQAWVHENISNSPEPLGWRNQISDGGELTALLRMAYEYRISDWIRKKWDQDFEPSEPYKKTNHFEATWLVEAYAGYYTNVASGFRGRLGFFRSEFWDFEGGPLNSVAQVTVETADRAEMYLYGSLQGRLVGRNHLLLGQSHDSVYTLEPEAIKRAIAEFHLGLVVSLPLSKMWRIGTGYNYSGRTTEIKGPFARTHTWGSVFLTVGRGPR